LRRYSITGRLVCRGDGETAVARIDINTGETTASEFATTELREITCNPAKCASYQSGECRRVMNLQFLLPDCPGFGVYQLDTSSFYSIVNVNSILELIGATCGRLSMLPLSLKLVVQEGQPEVKNLTFRTLKLTAPCSLFEIQKFAQIPPCQVLLLPAPDSEAPDDLFPRGVFSQNNIQKNSPCDDELIHLWNKATRLVRRIDMQNYQVVHYFSKYYHLQADIKDFELPMPPSKYNIENLNGFIKDIERHTRYS
jgi:hypothetical protein